MSKTIQLAGGLVLAAIGFGLGFYAGGAKDSRTAFLDATSPPGANSPGAHAPTADPTPPPAAVTAREAAGSVGEEGDDAILDALREADAFRRAARLATLFPTLGPEYASRARAALKSPRLDLGPVEVVLLARLWATHDPAAAATWAVHQSPLSYRAAVIGPTIELWARVAPEAAAQMVQAMGMGGLSKGTGATVGQIVLVRGWFDSGLPGLEDYIRGLGMGMERQRALGVFARKLIQRDGSQAAMRWAAALSGRDEVDVADDDARFKLEAFRQLGSELAQADPAAAVLWCEAQCEGPFGSMVRKLVAQRWAAQDPLPALQWLSTAPDGDEKDWAVRAALTGWWREDRAGLNEWMAPMATEGVPAWLQPALELYAMWTSMLRPEEAVEWAALLDDPVTREQTWLGIARRWYLRDPAAADPWIDQSALSPEAREKVRAPRPPRNRGRKPERARNRPSAAATPAP